MVAADVSADRIFVGGRWEPSSGDGRLTIVSPHTEEVLGTCPSGTRDDVDRAVSAAQRSFVEGSWRSAPVAERLAVLREVAAHYSTRLSDMATLITMEMGCPITFSELGQTTAALMIFNHYLEVGERCAWEERRTGAFSDYLVRREPVGVVGIIAPWNYPQGAIMAKLAPALIAGCSVVIKPAPETPFDALLLARILADAGVPDGVVSVVPGATEAGDQLVRSPGVDKIAFTGSTKVGREIGAICGADVRRCTLELGGKSAAIVLDDADIDTTIQGLRTASFMNSGQTCVAQTRVLVPRRLRPAFVEAFAEMAGSMQVGDPLDAATELGPLASRSQHERVTSYIALGRQEGARVVVGGGRPPVPGPGWYVSPTVFDLVDNGMRIAREEIFGPVVCVIDYDGEQEAIDLADDSPYGLAGSVWTSDPDRGLEIARRVRTGAVGVNSFAFDLDAPFGGFRTSGIGRELGAHGLDEYVELKSIAL